MDNRGSEIKKSNNVPLVTTGKYLFNADKMETVEISGKDLLKRKKVEMSTETLAGENITLVIKRDNYGVGISMLFFFDSSGADLVSSLGKSLDEWGGAKEDFYYQIAAYDFNLDGRKEIIVAGGNKQDILELCVYQFDPNLDYDRNNPKLLTTIIGSYKSYVNEQNDICVIDSGNNVSVYSYKGN